MRRLLLVLLLVVASSAVVEGAVPCDVARVSPSCFAALRPGPTEDALSIVSLSGLPTSTSSGQLVLTTVSVDADLDLGELWRTRTDPRQERVPRSLYFPEDVDEEDTRAEFAVMMEESQRTAVIAALNEVGIEPPQLGGEVRDLVPGSPADGLLEVGELVVSVDGAPTGSSTEIAEAVGAVAPGEVVELGVEGVDGTRRSVAVELAPNPDDASRGFLGVLLVTAVDLPVEVDVDAGGIGGPSAGMVFALSMVDQLRPDDLTGGRVVAGTGTIDLEGRVGAIGGVRQKVVGAQQRGEEPAAEVFLVPRGNLDEARGAAVVAEILLVPIDTLGDAVRALEALRDGGTPQDAVVLRPGEGSAAP